MAWSCLPGIPGLPGYSRCDCWNHHAYYLLMFSCPIGRGYILRNVSPVFHGIENRQSVYDLSRSGGSANLEECGGPFLCRFTVDFLSTYRK